MTSFFLSISTALVFKAAFVATLVIPGILLSIPVAFVLGTTAGTKLFFNFCNFYVSVSLFDQLTPIRYLFINIFNLFLEDIVCKNCIVFY